MYGTYYNNLEYEHGSTTSTMQLTETNKKLGIKMYLYVVIQSLMLFNYRRVANSYQSKCNRLK